MEAAAEHDEHVCVCASNKQPRPPHERRARRQLRRGEALRAGKPEPGEAGRGAGGRRSRNQAANGAFVAALLAAARGCCCLSAQICGLRARRCGLDSPVRPPNRRFRGRSVALSPQVHLSSPVGCDAITLGGRETVSSLVLPEDAMNAADRMRSFTFWWLVYS